MAVCLPEVTTAPFPSNEEASPLPTGGVRHQQGCRDWTCQSTWSRARPDLKIAQARGWGHRSYDLIFNPAPGLRCEAANGVDGTGFTRVRGQARAYQ